MYVIPVCLFSHPVYGHLDCFLILTTMNNVTKNMSVQISVLSLLSLLLGIPPRGGIAGSYDNSMLNFLFIYLFIYCQWEISLFLQNKNLSPGIHWREFLERIFCLLLVLEASSLQNFLKKSPYYFPQKLYHFIFSPETHNDSNFSTFLPTFVTF